MVITRCVMCMFLTKDNNKTSAITRRVMRMKLSYKSHRSRPTDLDDLLGERNIMGFRFSVQDPPWGRGEHQHTELDGAGERKHLLNVLVRNWHTHIVFVEAVKHAMPSSGEHAMQGEFVKASAARTHVGWDG